MGAPKRFTDQSVVVTGAGSGIGRQTALRFAEEGAQVVVADVDEEGGRETVEKITEEVDGEATFVEVDVTEETDVTRMVETAVSEYGSIDVAFNNAGIGGELEPTAEIDESDWQAIIDINLTGVWRCMRHEIPAMLEDGGGVIVNTASILGKVGSEGTPAYTASKHGVIGLTKTAAIEYATEDVRVNAVCPGYIETQMLDDAGVTEDEELMAQTKEMHAMKRLGKADEVADAVLWLSSPGASFTTGESLVVDGGYTSQ